MAQRDVDQLIADAVAALSAGLDDAAAIAVVAVEQYGAAMRTFCRDAVTQAGIPGAEQALRNRAIRLQKSRSAAPSGGSRGGLSDNEKSSIRSTKSAIRKDPEAATKQLLSDPEVREAIEKEVFTSAGQDHRKGQPNPVHRQQRQLELIDLLVNVESAMEEAMRALPDYIPNKDFRDQAEMDANEAEVYAQFLRDWAAGKSIADEVEAFLASE